MLSSARFQDFDGDIQRIHELLIYNQSHFADDIMKHNFDTRKY